MISLALLALISAAPATRGTAPSAPSVPAGWKLIWSDEFDKGDRPDPAKWAYETGFIRNNEAQYYTNRPENCRVSDGVLILEARKEVYAIPGKPPAQYTSASIETFHKQHFKYGRFEARVKIPSARGTWPAVWMLGENIGQAGWPLCGEIDIMEHVGFNPDKIHGTVHTRAYNHVKHTERGATTRISNPAEDFHVYAVEWTPEKVEFFFDGSKYYSFANEHKTVAEWPFDQPHFLKLNLAIGGAWGGQKGIDDTAFPHRMEVDYVRVYEKE